MPTIKSIEQARAKFAWTCTSKRHESIVGKIPTYIKTNGLLNTMAFLYSKESEGRGEALDDICKWLIGNVPNGQDSYPLIDKSQLSGQGSIREQVLDYLLDRSKSDARFLIQCTAEVLALFNWLRRFAKSE